MCSVLLVYQLSQNLYLFPSPAAGCSPNSSRKNWKGGMSIAPHYCQLHSTNFQLGHLLICFLLGLPKQGFLRCGIRGCEQSSFSTEGGHSWDSVHCVSKARREAPWQRLRGRAVPLLGLMGGNDWPIYVYQVCDLRFPLWGKKTKKGLLALSFLLVPKSH